MPEKLPDLRLYIKGVELQPERGESSEIRERNIRDRREGIREGAEEEGTCTVYDIVLSTVTVSVPS